MASEPAQSLEWAVDDGSRGTRLDVWLESRLDTISRSRIKTLITSGHVTRNGSTPKAHQKLAPGDRITITIPATRDETPHAEDIPLEVLYQDDDLVVINKSVGRVVHPAPGHETGTLVNALLCRYPQLSALKATARPGIVHRLDQDTSGAMIVALTDDATQALIQQFKDGSIEKQYDAIVSGCPLPGSGRIETAIGRHAVNRKRMAVCEDGGKAAVTEYRVVERFDDGQASLLSVRIETGRTHQIRVHMAHQGHPVLGDKIYARRRPKPWPERQMLHARHIVFTQPSSGTSISVEAPPPEDMTAFQKQLRGQDTGNAPL